MTTTPPVPGSQPSPGHDQSFSADLSSAEAPTFAQPPAQKPRMEIGLLLLASAALTLFIGAGNKCPRAADGTFGLAIRSLLVGVLVVRGVEVILGERAPHRGLMYWRTVRPQSFAAGGAALLSSLLIGVPAIHGDAGAAFATSDCPKGNDRVLTLPASSRSPLDESTRAQVVASLPTNLADSTRTYQLGSGDDQAYAMLVPVPSDQVGEFEASTETDMRARGLPAQSANFRGMPATEFGQPGTGPLIVEANDGCFTMLLASRSNSAAEWAAKILPHPSR